MPRTKIEPQFPTERLSILDSDGKLDAKLEPKLKPDGLRGLIEYYDCGTDDDCESAEQREPGSGAQPDRGQNTEDRSRSADGARGNPDADDKLRRHGEKGGRGNHHHRQPQPRELERLQV